MSWLDKLFGKADTTRDDDALWLYAQCNRCHAVLAVRIDRRNEVSADYESSGYVLYKEMMDSKCFQLMRAEIHYDTNMQVTRQIMENGKLITREEYEAHVNG